MCIVFSERACCALLLLFFLPSTVVNAGTREYYIAAEAVDWDYAPSGKDLTHDGPLSEDVRDHTRWRKVRYIEYEKDDFKTRKQQPAWLGILGPVLRAEVGDTVIVHFLNNADRPYSMHPHGLRYTKDHEGARYSPAGPGAAVEPGKRHTYVWLADETSGPGPQDPSSIVWWYHSHVHEPEETQRGLLGPIIVTAKGRARSDGTPSDIDREFVTLFMIFKEKQQTAHEQSPLQLNAINGYIYGNLQGLEMQNGERVRWYLLGMGGEEDLHTVHWHGKPVEAVGQHTDVVELLPGSMKTATMGANNPGTWLYHCHVEEHLQWGMHTRFVIHAPTGTR